MASQETDESAKRCPLPLSARCPGNLEAEACLGRRTRRDAKACVRVCARVCSSGVGRAGAARCARPARRGLETVDDRSRQFEFFLEQWRRAGDEVSDEETKTPVDAKSRSDENLMCVIGVLKRTPRTKPPPVWVPLPAVWVIISPRRREARDGGRRERRKKKEKIFPRASSNLEPRRRRRRRRVVVAKKIIQKHWAGFSFDVLDAARAVRVAVYAVFSAQ